MANMKSAMVMLKTNNCSNLALKLTHFAATYNTITFSKIAKMDNEQIKISNTENEK